MTNRPKAIGTAAESAVVRAVRTRGFPGADREPLRGTLDTGDIGLTAGVVIEVKAGEKARRASDALIANWLAETERERVNAHAHIGILITVRSGIGPANAHNWWAHMTTGTLIDLIWSTGRDAFQPESITSTTPVRMTLDAALELLRANGYGDPLRPAEATA